LGLGGGGAGVGSLGVHNGTAAEGVRALGSRGRMQ